MADRIDIPAALRDEIRADLEAGGTRPDRWRPATADEAPVIALAYGDGRAYGPVEPVGVIGTAYGNWPSIDYDPYLVLRGNDPVAATAWAPVGGVDSGPRPDIGDRVMIVEILGGYDDPGQVGTVRMIDDILGRIGVDLDGGRSAYATRWAILPPEVRVVESVTADDVARIHGATMAQPPPGWDETQRLRSALREIVNTLGPDRVCTCTGPDCGIRAEAAEALRIAREALTTEVRGG